MNIFQDAKEIINSSIKEVLPVEAVKKALKDKIFSGNIYVVAIGKAAWTMANATYGLLSDKKTKGIVITKYDHSQGAIGDYEIIEAGHPVPDENSILATKKAIALISNLNSDDTVIFLISGGGSALFELPMENICLNDIMDITKELLNSGADIVEINTVRKHLSAVKGGRFANLCLPANIFSIVLSDVLGDKLDSIASGPAYPDSSTSQDALNIINKYNIKTNDNILKSIMIETPKTIMNCETIVTGSVFELCKKAATISEELGYKPIVLTTNLDCEAKEAGKVLAAIVKTIKNENIPIKPPCAVIMGGETIVKITGTGKGGRNQELALSSATAIGGISDVVIASVGSDGTDGPTDAAGGIVDGGTLKRLKDNNIDVVAELNNNNSYYALSKIDGLIITGPTGTNVNDLTFALIK